MTCPMCGSLYAIILGALGRLTWYRCRDCGIDYSRRSRARGKQPDYYQQGD